MSSKQVTSSQERVFERFELFLCFLSFPLYASLNKLQTQTFYVGSQLPHPCVISRGEAGMDNGVVGYRYAVSEQVVECS